MSSWVETSVGDLAAPIRNALVGGPFGSNLTSRDYVDSGVPVVRGVNLSSGRWLSGDFAYVSEEKAESLSANCGTRGDLLFTQRGTLGQVALAPPQGPERFLVSQSQMKLSVNLVKASPLFLYYVFMSPAMQNYIQQHAIQTGVPHINLGILRETPVLLPPLEEQKRIAGTLGALDDKIESNRRLLDVALALLDATAVQVRETVPSVKLGSVASPNRATVDPSQLGDVMADHYSLPAFDAEARPDRVSAVTIKSNKIAVPGEAVLVSRLNPRINRTWWVKPRHGVPALASTEFACLTVPEGESLAALWLAVRDQHFRQELTRRTTGTSGSHQRVRPQDLLDIEVPNVSELPETTKGRAQALLNLTDQRREESARLASLRDALLPELLSGRIRVPEAIELVEEAVG